MIRIGVDFGGTKIEAAALDAEGRFQARVRGPSPADYQDGLEAVKALVEEAERQAGARAERIGVGGPGSASPATGLMRGANSTQLNGRRFRRTWRARWAERSATPTTPTAWRCRKRPTGPQRAPPCRSR